MTTIQQYARVRCIGSYLLSLNIDKRIDDWLKKCVVHGQYPILTLLLSCVQRLQDNLMDVASSTRTS